MNRPVTMICNGSYTLVVDDLGWCEFPRFEDALKFVENIGAEIVSPNSGTGKALLSIFDVKDEL